MVEIFDYFTPAQQLALTHSNLFTDVYNSHVVAKMNKLCAKFPDKSQLFSDMNGRMKEFSRILMDQNENSQMGDTLKEMLEQTQRFNLTMFGQRQLSERLMRETKYGIIGDATVSAANPASELMKINKTYRQFIKESEYADEDKDILLDVFETGNKTLETFEKV